MFDQISYSDSSLPFGTVHSADHIRAIFADNDTLFGFGQNHFWETGLTLWSFIGQVLQDGKQRSCDQCGQASDNGYVESFNARMRDELLDGEIFLTLAETKYVVDRWRMDYNHYRPHSSLAYMIPAEIGQLCIKTDCRRTQRKQLNMSIKYGVEKAEILS